MTPEQQKIIMKLRCISIQRYELDREEEQLLFSLSPVKRRKILSLKDMQDGINKEMRNGKNLR